MALSLPISLLVKNSALPTPWINTQGDFLAFQNLAKPLPTPKIVLIPAGADSVVISNLTGTDIWYLLSPSNGLDGGLDYRTPLSTSTASVLAYNAVPVTVSVVTNRFLWLQQTNIYADFKVQLSFQ